VPGYWQIRLIPTKREGKTMNKLRIFSALVMGLVVIGVGSVPAAQASPPDISESPVNETRDAFLATRTCGFQVLVQREGTIRLITRYDESGNPVKEVGVLHVEDTFMANGRSITGFERYIIHTTYNADGSLDVLYAGPDRWVVQPGGGPVWGTAGSATIHISPEGEVTTIRESGPSRDFSPELCAALTS
jgi:hypothetical protein